MFRFDQSMLFEFCLNFVPFSGNYLKSKPTYNKVLQSSLCSLALPPAKASGSHQNTCWLCRNCWLYENRWVGEAGPPKYSTLWLLWTPINFLNSLVFTIFFPKGLGEGCDPRKRNHQCNGGLICYQKSDKLWDGMCVPGCRNGKYIDYKKIIGYKENPKKESNGTLLRDDQFF